MMPTTQDTERKITSFTALRNGWHYGQGRAITEQALSAGLAILWKLAMMRFQNVDAFPGIEGDVQVTAYEQDDFYEFNFNLDGTYLVVHERKGEVLFCEEGLSLAETLRKIEEFAFEKCEQSDSSTQSNLTTISTFTVFLTHRPETSC